MSIRTKIDDAFTLKLKPLGLTADLIFHVDSGTSYNALTGKVTSTITNTTVLGAVTGYDQGLVDGDVIQRGDLRAMVSGVAIDAAGFEPDKGMVVDFIGKLWTIVSFARHMVGEEVGAWEIQLRGS